MMLHLCLSDDGVFPETLFKVWVHLMFLMKVKLSYCISLLFNILQYHAMFTKALQRDSYECTEKKVTKCSSQNHIASLRSSGRPIFDRFARTSNMRTVSRFSLSTQGLNRLVDEEQLEKKIC